MFDLLTFRTSCLEIQKDFLWFVESLQVVRDRVGKSFQQASVGFRMIEGAFGVLYFSCFRHSVLDMGH